MGARFRAGDRQGRDFAWRTGRGTISCGGQAGLRVDVGLASTTLSDGSVSHRTSGHQHICSSKVPIQVPIASHFVSFILKFL